MSDPMTDEQLEEIRQRLDHTPAVPFTVLEPGVARVTMGDLRRIVHTSFSLLCEVERLRDENAALREIATPVAYGLVTDYPQYGPVMFHVGTDWPALKAKARAILAAPEAEA